MGQIRGAFPRWERLWGGALTLGEDDVLGLDISVHDSCRVQSVQGEEELPHDRLNDLVLPVQPLGLVLGLAENHRLHLDHPFPR